MSPRKALLRGIAIDIIAGRERTQYAANQATHLFLGIERRSERQARRQSGAGDAELSSEDKLLAREIFWDLLIERVITPGLDDINPLPFFRVHSEVGGRLG